MPVDQHHPQYDAHTLIWKRCRDCVAGEDAVKKVGDPYLPKLDGQSEVEYGAYKTRALFYNAAKRTKQAIAGAVFRKQPQIEPPSDYIEQKCRDAYGEIIEVGRIGVLTDAPPAGSPKVEPYMVVYRAEDIINWAYDVVNDKKVLTLVVLQENTNEIDPEDEFNTRPIIRFRVLDLVRAPGAGEGGDRIYRVRVFRQNENKQGSVGQQNVAPNLGDTQSSEAFVQEGGDIYPTVRGEFMNAIPFEFCSAEDDSPDISMPPMYDLINVNLSHYRSSADLEHGRHFTALPTAWIAGFGKEGEYKIGSGTAWVTENVQARAGFLEFTGAGLGALENALIQKEHLMAVLGARLFENPKQGVEAAETVRLRQSADTATAASMSRLVSDCIERSYQRMLDMSLTGGAASVEISTDILDQAIDPAMIQTLLAARQAGEISRETFLNKLQEGEVLIPGETIEDEISRIKVEEDELTKKLAVMEKNAAASNAP